MSQWKNVDNANSAPVTAVAAFKKPASQANRDAFFGNTTADAIKTGLKVGIFGADTAETTAESAITHAGWVVRKEGTGGRAGRVQYETLVAMGSMTADAEDVVLPDIKIFFKSQPANQAVVGANAASFAVTTDSTPTGAAVTYQWQANTGAGFTNLTNAGVYTGVTTATLAISAGTGLNGVQYRAVASSAGANTITSKAAVLTVS